MLFRSVEQALPRRGSKDYYQHGLGPSLSMGACTSSGRERKKRGDGGTGSGEIEETYGWEFTSTRSNSPIPAMGMKLVSSGQRRGDRYPAGGARSAPPACDEAPPAHSASRVRAAETGPILELHC